MKELICRWLGHDWLPIFETRVCECNNDCLGTYRAYSGTVCRRCELWSDVA